MKKFIFISLLIVLCLRASAQDGLMQVNGTKLFVKSFGSGEPILFIHGGPGLNHSYFLPHVERLAKKNQVILYDQRASGKSYAPSSDSISLDFFADDIEALLKNLGHNKAIILAHSWGIIPAIEFCVKYPGRVKGLIFCNAMPLSHEFDGDMKRRQLDKTTGLDSTDRAIIMGSPNFRAGKATAYQKLLMLSFRKSFYRPANFKKLQLEVPDNYKEASTALYTGLGKELSDYNYYDELANFQFPVLILYGEADLIPLEATEKAANKIPRSTKVAFKKSGHFIFIEEPKRFTSEIQKFVSRTAMK